MEAIVNYLIYSAGILTVFCLTYHLLLRKLTFFQLNRWFLLLGLVASISIPLIEIEQTVYKEREAVIGTEIPLEQLLYIMQQDVQPVQETIAAQEDNGLSELLIYLYIAVALGFLGKMVIELLSLFKLMSKGKRFKQNGYTHIVLAASYHGKQIAPFSFFNYICYTPKGYSDQELEIILDHERVHANQMHSLDLLLSHIYRAVFWINPLSWIIKRQIGENLEFIADSQASARTDDSLSYEYALLSSAAGHLQPALANNFFTPFIKKRIQMLQQQASKKWHIYKYAFILPVIVLSLYSFNVVEKIEWVEPEIPASDDIDTVEAPVIGYPISTNPVPVEENTLSLGEYSTKTSSSIGDEGSAFAKATTPNDTEILLIKISPDMSREELDKKVENLAKEGITLNIKKAKYRDGKLTHLSFEISDGNGFTASKSSKSSSGISAVCIVKSTSNGKTKWQVSECDSIALEGIDDDQINELVKGFAGDQSDLMTRIEVMGANGYSIMKVNDTLSRNALAIIELHEELAAKQALEIEKQIMHIQNISNDSLRPNGYVTILNNQKALTAENLAIQERALTKALRELERSRLNMARVVIDSTLRSSLKASGISIDSLKSQFSNQDWEIAIDSALINLEIMMIDLDSIQERLGKQWEEMEIELENLELPLILESPENLLNYQLLDNNKQPLVIINGQKYTYPKIYDLKSDIKSVNVIKGANDPKVYGKDGENGVIIIEAEEPIIFKNNSTDQEIIVVEGKLARNATGYVSDILRQEKIDNPTKEKLESYGKELQELGYDFKIRRCKERDGKIVKLKIDFAGSKQTIVTNQGIKSITFTFFKDGRKPKMNSVTY